MKKLTYVEVQVLVSTVAASQNKAECRSCECYLGFLAQMKVDAVEDISDLVDVYGAQGQPMHGCLGCDPCPPGAAFTEYLRNDSRSR